MLPEIAKKKIWIYFALLLTEYLDFLKYKCLSEIQMIYIDKIILSFFCGLTTKIQYNQKIIISIRFSFLLLINSNHWLNQ